MAMASSQLVEGSREDEAIAPRWTDLPVVQGRESPRKREPELGSECGPLVVPFTLSLFLLNAHEVLFGLAHDLRLI